MLITKKFIEVLGIGTCEVLHRGHWEDTVIVKTPDGKTIEIQWGQFYLQEDHKNESSSH